MLINIECFNFKEPDYCLNLNNVLTNYVFQDIVSKDFDKIDKIRYFMENLRSSFSDFIILGAGGSINTLNMMLEIRPKSNVHVIDSLNFEKVSQLISKINPEKTCVFCITKSGISRDINLQLKFIFDHFKKSVKEIEKHFYFITTENGRKNLDHLLDFKISDANFIDHDQNISGRFSSFAPSFIYVGFLLGLNIRKYIEGAIRCIYDVNNGQFSCDILNKTISILNKDSKFSNINVIMSYSKLSANFLTWYEQIIAESTGKDGNGVTPIVSVCPEDQHSKLQLFLDGPRDKFFTIFIDDKEIDRSLKNRTIETDFEILKSDFCERTIAAIKETGMPLKIIKLKELDESILGYLLTYIMIETIAICDYFGCNPFNQPGVEKLKLKEKI